MKYYYTASEARQHLGISLGTFYYLIDIGKIRRVAAPGKKRGLYSKHLIERLAEERLKGVVGEKESGTIFMKAALGDLLEEYELAVLMLNGSAGYGLPTYEAWLRKNSETNFIVRDQGRLVAFMQVLPVRRNTIRRWVKGEIREWEISAEDVLSYTPNSSMGCILTSMVITSDVDKQKRRLYGTYLIRGFLHFLQDLAERHVTITSFYAASATPEGSAFLRRATFEPGGQNGRRMVFELNPISSDLRIAKAYRAVLRNRKQDVSAMHISGDDRRVQTRTLPYQYVF